MSCDNFIFLSSLDWLIKCFQIQGLHPLKVAFGGQTDSLSEAVTAFKCISLYNIEFDFIQVTWH